MTPQEEQERYLIEIIDQIKADYLKAVQPYVERLIKLRAMSIRPEFPMVKR